MEQDNPASELKDETKIAEKEIEITVDEPKERKLQPKEEGRFRGNILYTVDEVPRWYLCFLLGFQQCLMMFGTTVAYSYLVTPKLCIPESDPARGYITSTLFFVSGLGSLIQSTFGTRLPIIQGPLSAFLAPIFAILSLPQWKCPSEEEMLSATEEELQEIWQIRMREIQGAIIVASIFEIVIGLSGVIGIILQWLTPLVIVPTISLIGLLYTSKILIFLVVATVEKEDGRSKTASFQAFPAIRILRMLHLKKRVDNLYFYFGLSGQWGLPTVTISSVLGMFAGILASVLKSIGNYYASARIACAPPPPTGAINRGIFAEGISCTISGIWGSGCGMTSYSQNIGAIGITKVASRRVIQYGAVTMMIFAVLGKFGAFLNIIPEPIIGGIICVTFALVTGVGLSNVQFIDLHSSRNTFILGFSLFLGITIPKWFSSHPGTIDVGNDVANQLITVLLNTSVFVGGLIAFVLDNSIPGTEEERGLIKWREQGLEQNRSEGDQLTWSSPSTYDLPFGMNLIKRYKIFKYIPISPTYDQNSLFGSVRSLFKKIIPQINCNRNID
ncbi:solute carrier family 23 member 1-like [Tachypleus tridentatus]|uniref:solute carrier family 23 member 1-like n=1 Tax=Tachypleus tridentatus TaxID=6853 RepID=UPI003FD59A89